MVPKSYVQLKTFLFRAKLVGEELFSQIFEFFNCSQTKLVALFLYVLVFFMQFFRLTVFALSCRLFSDFSSDFSRFRASILSDVYCPHSAVRLLAKIKSI